MKPLDPLFSQILPDPESALRQWISDWFDANPLAEVPAHDGFITGQDMYGEIYAYARLFTQHGYLESDQGGRPIERINPYGELDTGELLSVCQSIYFYALSRS